MDQKTFAVLSMKVSNSAIAKAMRNTAELLDKIEKELGGVESPLGSIICLEAARRLDLIEKPADASQGKLLEDLTKRIYELITPENVALGVEGLKRKLIEVVAAN